MNLRSRAAFKLEEIEKKHKVLGGKILDLGSAPGSWSEIAYRILPESKVVAVDILQVASS